jgi:hypothetical protein
VEEKEQLARKVCWPQELRLPTDREALGAWEAQNLGKSYFFREICAIFLPQDNLARKGASATPKLVLIDFSPLENSEPHTDYAAQD